MAYCGNASNVDKDASYKLSFGNLADGTAYYDPMGLKGNKIDAYATEKGMKETNPMLKALTVVSGGAGTAGYALVPVFVDPRIVDRTRKQTPLVTILPRVTNMGMYADYNVITAKGGGYTAFEDAALPETNTTYDRASTAIKFLYAVGRITGPSFAATPGYTLDGITQSGTPAVGVNPFGSAAAPNSMQLEVLVKTRELKELEENLIINGNSSTSGISGNPNGSEFDGIVALMSTTNTVGKSTAYIDLADIDLAASYAFDDGGFPTIAICDSSTYNDVLKLLSDRIGYMNSQVETEYGFTAIRFNTMAGQLLLIPSRFMTTTTGSKAMYLLDPTVWEIRVLQDMTYEELAKVNDSRKFMLKSYETLICRAPAFNASITAIK